MATAHDPPEADGDVDPDEDFDEVEAEAAPPAVAAVVVCHDPGPWFEETLASLRDQDYPNLVVVVIDAASAEDPTHRVAAVLPTAFVRRLDENRGYAASANAALETVEGATHLVFCHDDVAAESDAIRLMVEEAFRSNAAVVAPKLVAWDDASRILSVGMNVDKLGALAERVVPGELDQEQHDSVRDVFVAPGAFTLVRSDLFTTLGGFDPAITMFGEDLDLCWRAQVAGARVVAAPAARVRHIEVTRSGTRPTPGAASKEEVRALVRRHELRTVLKCYRPWHLARVLPQAALASLAEIVLSVVAGKFARAGAVARAWTWNLSSLADLRRERRKVQSQRHLPDREIRASMVSGFARVSSLVRRIVASYEGVHPLTLHGVEGHEPDEDGADEDGAAVEPFVAADRHPAPASAAPESAAPESLTGSAAPAAPPRSASGGPGAPGTSPRAKALFSVLGRWEVQPPTIASAGLLATLVLVAVGMRHWVTADLPATGQLAPLPSSLSLLHRYIDGGRAAGLGSYSPAPPAFAAYGLAGTVLFGATGFLQKLLFLGALPAGAIGVYRLTRAMGGQLPRLVATVAYLAVPLPYDLFASGRLDALVAYGATPWLLVPMLAASGYVPFGTARTVSRSARRSAGHAVQRGWLAVRDELARRSPLRRWLTFSMGLAVVASFAPGEIVVLIAILIGLLLGSFVVDQFRGWGRSVRFTAGGIVTAAVLLFPWLPSFRGTWNGLVPLLGQGGDPRLAAGLPSIVRFDVGYLGAGFAGYLLLVPAGLAVVIGAGWRFRWAVRLWGVMVFSWLAAWAGVHGWLGGSAVDPGLLLVPAAVAVAAAAGLGAIAFAVDLSSHRFGWRQAVSAAAAAGLVLASLPEVASLAGGQFHLPSGGWGEVLAGLESKVVPGTGSSAGSAAPGTGSSAGSAASRSTPVPAGGASRTVTASPGLTLWIGDPRALPMGSWPLSPSLAYAVSLYTVPDATYLWPPVDPHETARIGSALAQARDGLTTHIGRQLAAFGVTAVAVPLQLSPGSATPPVAPPAWVMPALVSQSDLNQLQIDPSVAYFVNAAPSPGMPAGSNVHVPAAPAYRYLEVALQAALWAGSAWFLVGNALLAMWRRRPRRRPGSSPGGPGTRHWGSSPGGPGTRHWGSSPGGPGAPRSGTSPSVTPGRGER